MEIKRYVLETGYAQIFGESPDLNFPDSNVSSGAYTPQLARLWRGVLLTQGFQNRSNPYFG